MEEMIPILLLWYETSKRDLPWRSNKDSYSIWISEIMLQQTRVEAVIPYYERFMARLPRLTDLAKIEEEELFKLWQGLGYYSRARNLKKAAQIILNSKESTLPKCYDDLIKLPGIGSYTAGAIASIAYQERVPAVDGNVLRVLARFLGKRDNISDIKTKKKFEQYLLPYMPEESGEFNQALMELGATICIPNGNPRCNICPVACLCQSRKKGLIAELPVKEKKKQRKIEKRTIFLFMNQEKVAIRKRPEIGLLASLYEFQNEIGHLSELDVKTFLSQQNIDGYILEKIGPYRHIFTHLEWDMIGYCISVENKFNEEFLWVTMEELKNIYSIPTAFHKFEEMLLHSSYIM